MSTILEVTSPAFRGLTNPYTGEPMAVRMMVPKTGEPLFFAPDTYSTADRYPSRAEAVAAWDRTDGKAGLKSGAMFICAYTGKALTPRSNGEQAWFAGGFDPHVMRPRAEFLHYAAMRNGVSPYPLPDKPPRVTRPEPPAPPETPAASDISADAQAEAERIADEIPDAFERRTTVSMAVPGRGKRKEARHG